MPSHSSRSGQVYTVLMSFFYTGCVGKNHLMIIWLKSGLWSNAVLLCPSLLLEIGRTTIFHRLGKYSRNFVIPCRMFTVGQSTADQLKKKNRCQDKPEHLPIVCFWLSVCHFFSFLFFLSLSFQHRFETTVPFDLA